MVRINDDEETRTVYGECLVCGRGDSVQIDSKTSRPHDGHSDDSWDDFKLAAAMVGADRSPAAFLWRGMCPDHASTPDLGKRRTGVDEALDGDSDDPADSSESDASDADAHGDAATGSLDAQPHSRPSLP